MPRKKMQAVFCDSFADGLRSGERRIKLNRWVSV